MTAPDHVLRAAAVVQAVRTFHRDRAAQAATVAQRAEADRLAADALALVVESGMTAAEIRAAVTRQPVGWPVDDHDVHAVRTGRYDWDPAASYPIGDPHRGQVTP